jgi:hypothetical protein
MYGDSRGHTQCTGIKGDTMYGDRRGTHSMYRDRRGTLSMYRDKRGHTQCMWIEGDKNVRG